jgi:hypothetical protein
MSIRKEKEREFFVEHMPTFRILQANDPFFVIKTAFFQKGKYGRQVQFFESELSKGEDIFIEFYENIKDGNGADLDVVPMYDDRQLFKYKHNKYFAEEYEQKENVNFKGETYHTFTVPVSELIAVLKDGSEITYALYEKRKNEVQLKTVADELPRLQKSLSLFPDFEGEYLKNDLSLGESEIPKMEESAPEVQSTLANISLKDFAAIMLVKPVSDKQWLNDLITEAKKDL